MDRLMYRRQFLLSKELLAELNGWNTLNVGSYYLYVHPDLEVNRVEASQKSIVLIGSLFDPHDPIKDNFAILKDILHFANRIETLILRIKKYAGSYVMLYHNENEFAIWSDARATQEIYYCTKNNRIICGSQPNLISKFGHPEIKPASDPLLRDFYKNHLWDSRWVGDETYYDSVKHLLPNHYLDINKHESRRYWPNEPIKILSLEEAASKSCTYLQGIMRAIVPRHSVMMAVTAGTDSRTLLAASKDILNSLYLFINNRRLGNDHPDIIIPKRILENIGRDFHVHDVPDDVDEEFRKIYFSNTFLATERLLPSVYNVFYKEHSDKVLIVGVGEIGRTFYGTEPKKLSSHRMAYKLGYSKCTYVINQFEKYLAEMLPAAHQFYINPMVILYWEQRLGNWGAARNSESNIAIEWLDPFNSHFLNEIFLGVDEKYKNYQEAPCALFKEMIRSMWPALLEYPVNPPNTIMGKIKTLLRIIKAYEHLKELKYQVSYMGYLYRTRK